MVKKGLDYDSISETGNWNVAKEYSKLKIMNPLVLADQYQTIAVFGTSSFIEELQINFNTDVLKIKALKRLIYTLTLLIDNSIFAIKKKPDKDKMKEARENLKKFETFLPLLYDVKKNNVKKTSSLRIRYDRYEEILEGVIGIKSQLNDYLNGSDLLFIDKEDFDPVAYKDKVKGDLSSTG